jgi:hypothetical protein
VTPKLYASLSLCCGHFFSIFFRQALTIQQLIEFLTENVNTTRMARIIEVDMTDLRLL